MAYGILAAHNQASPARETGGVCGPDPVAGPLRLRFDALASHDITYVNIIQTAKASGLGCDGRESFPLPYILSNCHNSLCAVGGTINEDDHLFGLSAAQKYGGIYVPAHLAVIHSYVRETLAGCGKMILGSDSHTRYGALGSMGVGEGGGELVKQLLSQTYDMAYPGVVGVYLAGRPRPGVGPQDIALALIGAVFKEGTVKNAVLEFVGPGIAALSADFRCGIDVMSTETACWSSIWETDETVRDYLALHGRTGDYRPLRPGDVAYYDRMISVDLAAIRPMIALPFHPSNVYEIDTLLASPGDILRQVEKEAAELIAYPGLSLRLSDKIDGRGRIAVDQGIIAGCAGGSFENIMAAAAILDAETGPAPDTGFNLSIYPGSQPLMLDLSRNGCLARLLAAGALVRSAFCGPCFGAGDVPANQGLSIRHTTRNFPNREGSRPMDGQIAAIALMDARSIAATARNGGFLASAEAAPGAEAALHVAYRYDDAPYRARVYQGWGAPRPETALRYGPNITGWPEMEALGENLLLKIVSFISDPVTTTDEIIPSGETSSYRSNPLGLAEFTLSRKDPGYVGRAKAVSAASRALAASGTSALHAASVDLPPTAAQELPELAGLLARIGRDGPLSLASAIYAVKPGDGSAREQAASCQRVLGGAANFAREYATKRYRSNLINWGILPFTLPGEPPFGLGDYVYIPGIARALRGGERTIRAYTIHNAALSNATCDLARCVTHVELSLPVLSEGERDIILAGSLINFNRVRKG
jgi:aconitate hydratase